MLAALWQGELMATLGGYGGMWISRGPSQKQTGGISLIKLRLDLD